MTLAIINQSLFVVFPCAHPRYFEEFIKNIQQRFVWISTDIDNGWTISVRVCYFAAAAKSISVYNGQATSVFAAQCCTVNALALYQKLVCTIQLLIAIIDAKTFRVVIDSPWILWSFIHLTCNMQHDMCIACIKVHRKIIAVIIFFSCGIFTAKLKLRLLSKRLSTTNEVISR